MSKKKQEINFRPLYDKVIVEKIEEKKVTKGGILIPDNAKERPQEGIIVAVGKGRMLDDGTVVALDVKVGDRVLYSTYAGQDMPALGEEYLMMREPEIIGVIEE